MQHTENACIIFKSVLKLLYFAGVVELADAPDSKSGGLITRVGSTPTTGTKKTRVASFFVPNARSRCAKGNQCVIGRSNK